MQTVPDRLEQHAKELEVWSARTVQTLREVAAVLREVMQPGTHTVPELRLALREYGRHKHNCRRDHPTQCSCGYQALIDGTGQ